jgi:hypothetical protein
MSGPIDWCAVISLGIAAANRRSGADRRLTTLRGRDNRPASDASQPDRVESEIDERIQVEYAHAADIYRKGLERKDLCPIPQPAAVCSAAQIQAHNKQSLAR